MKVFEETSGVHTVVVHSFNMGDVEDPDLFAGQPLYEWQESPAGKWIMEVSALTPSWHRIPRDYGWKYEVHAYLADKDYTFYKLKYD
jgi:hypothetical protein